MEDVVDIEITSDQVRRLEDTDDPDWLGTASGCKSHGLVSREAAEALVDRGDARFRTIDETGDESITHPDARQQCVADTADGDRCENGALEGSEFCGIHQPDE